MSQQDNIAVPLEKFLDRSYVHSRLEESLGQHSKSDILYGDLAKPILKLALTDSLSGSPRREVRTTFPGQITELVKANADFSPRLYQLGYDFGEAIKRETSGQRGVIGAANAVRSLEVFLINFFTFFEPDYDTKTFLDADRDTPLLKYLLSLQ